MSKTYIFGHKSPDTDSIASTIVMENYEKKLGNNEVEGVRIGNLNKETQYVFNRFGFKVPRMVENLDDVDQVILVDHNEFNQSADGIENVKILKVVDHHRINNFKTSEPLYYRAEPVGCTGTILYEMYKEKNIEMTPDIATLCLSAIISDTLLLKSPTCTSLDEKAAFELANIAKLDINEYGLEMLKAGTDLSDLNEKELINIDGKEFDISGKKVKVAQINTASIPDMLKRQEKIEEEMKKEISEKSLSLFIVMVTDIIENNSEIIVLGDEISSFENGFNVKLENNSAYLPGVVSRKKQIVPIITEALK